MRIIAGTLRGRVIISASDRSIRPTADRAKQTIFDILSNRLDFAGIGVLDLFAGSGSLGLEAISRGAATVTFVDSSSQSLAILEKNVIALGCKSQSTLYQADAFWFLKNTARTYDLIFVDPPYALETIGTLPTAIYNSKVVRDGSHIVMEHNKESEVSVGESMYTATRKPFGQTTVLILKALIPASRQEGQTNEDRNLSRYVRPDHERTY